LQKSTDGTLIHATRSLAYHSGGDLARRRSTLAGWVASLMPRPAGAQPGPDAPGGKAGRFAVVGTPVLTGAGGACSQTSKKIVNYRERATAPAACPWAQARRTPPGAVLSPRPRTLPGPPPAGRRVRRGVDSSGMRVAKIPLAPEPARLRQMNRGRAVSMST